jgi:hypothetical protein
VTAYLSSLRNVSAAALLLIGGSFAAYADEPTPAALEASRAIVADWGMLKSFDIIVPQLLDQVERNITATRPELKDNLRAVLIAIKPEFDKTEQDTITEAVKVLASQMTEQELKDTAAFFQTPSGKKYIATEPGAITQILVVVENWRQKMSVDLLKRAHEEMKKKGTDF